MIITFFEGDEYTTGIDYSGHPDCIFQTEIDEFDEDTHAPALMKNPETGEYSVEIVEIPEDEREKDDESPHEKRQRIFAEIVDAETLEGFELEGVEFSDKEVGDIIVARVFGGNPHAQMALQAKILDMMITGEKNPDLMAKILEKKAKINEIRAFFGMGAL